MLFHSTSERFESEILDTKRFVFYLHPSVDKEKGLDTTIIVAIIGAIAVIVAAIISAFSKMLPKKRHEYGTSEDKAKAFDLGFQLAAIKVLIETFNPVGLAGDMQKTRANGITGQAEIAAILAHSIMPDIEKTDSAEELLKKVPKYIGGTPSGVRAAYSIGDFVGVGYSLALFAALTPLIDVRTVSIDSLKKMLSRIDEIKNLSRQADLPSDFIEPVRKHWNRLIKDDSVKNTATSETDAKNSTNKINEEMFPIIDHLKEVIERQ